MRRWPVKLLALGLILSGCGRKRDTIYEGYAFVATSDGPSLAVVDLAAFSVARRIPLRVRPVEILSDPARRVVYVMGEGGPAGLTVIDAAKLEVRRAVWLAERPLQIRLSADGRRLYALDGRTRSLRSLDAETLAHGPEIRLGKPPVDFEVSPDGRWACVSLATGEAAVVDLEKGAMVATSAVGREPAEVAVRFDARQAFVANRADGTVSVLDLPSGKLVTHLALGARPSAMRFKPDGGELFVSGGDGGMVTIISAYRDEVDQPLLTGSGPGEMAITADNRVMYVVNSAANTVSVIDIDQRRTLAAVPVGEEPMRVALTSDNQFALVLNRRSGDLAVIRRRVVEDAREPIRPLFTLIPVGRDPVDLAVQAR